jgi:hypothetical protein
VPQWVVGAPRFVVASGPPLGGPPTGTVTVVAFATHALLPPPATRVTGLTPAGFGEARIAVGGSLTVSANSQSGGGKDLTSNNLI